MNTLHGLPIIDDDGNTLGHMTTIEVSPDADKDDCLAAAERAYIERHPELAGWDLEPRWADDENREWITLTVPTWASKDEDHGS